MAITTCPTDVLTATPERVWAELSNAAAIASWSGARLVSGPDRPLAVGDLIVLAPGFGFRVQLDILGAEPPRQLVVDAHLPFGVVNHEVIQVTPLDGGRCRVTFN